MGRLYIKFQIDTCDTFWDTAQKMKADFWDISNDIVQKQILTFETPVMIPKSTGIIGAYGEAICQISSG